MQKKNMSFLSNVASALEGSVEQAKIMCDLMTNGVSPEYAGCNTEVFHDTIVPASCVAGMRDVVMKVRREKKERWDAELNEACMPWMTLLAMNTLGTQRTQSLLAAKLESYEIADIIARNCTTPKRFIILACVDVFRLSGTPFDRSVIVDGYPAQNISKKNEPIETGFRFSPIDGEIQITSIAALHSRIEHNMATGFADYKELVTPSVQRILDCLLFFDTHYVDDSIPAIREANLTSVMDWRLLVIVAVMGVRGIT